MHKRKLLWGVCGGRRAAACAFERPAVMAVLRGKGLGLEIALGERDLEEALAELQSKLGERPGFYAGTHATASVGRAALSPEEFARLRSVLDDHGIVLDGISVDETGGEGELARRRALRPKRELQLSDAARSLVADFEGARKDIATRRSRGETSVRRITPAAEPEPELQAQLPEIAPAPPATLYHVGTLRGGQALHNVGNIVVIGDVNPGAELVAGGDIAVFGSLRGVAHAGAQGDAGARVYAVDLSPTQLRIATLIATDAGGRGAAKHPEAACVQNDRITVVPLSSAGVFEQTKEKVE